MADCLDSNLASLGLGADLANMGAIPVCRPLLPSVEKIFPYFSTIDQARYYTNHGPLVRSLQERLVSQFHLRGGSVLAASGTAALVGAILAVAGRATAERPLCLLPTYTFIGTLSAVELCGYTPYLIDVEPDTWMLDADRCGRHAALDRVGLVVPVAAYGRSMPQAGWSALCDRTGIPVVIDGAAALEKLLLEPDIHMGDIPVAVSFHATKVFGTGEGGAVFCSNEAVLGAAQKALNFGYTYDRTAQCAAMNGKMNEYSAAIGLAELDGWAAKREAYHLAAHRYREAASAAGIADQFHLSPLVASNYAMFEAVDRRQSAAVQCALSEAGIGHRLWYGPGLHRQPYGSTFGRDDLIRSESLADRLIGIPMSVDISPEDIRLVVQLCGEAVDDVRRNP